MVTISTTAETYRAITANVPEGSYLARRDDRGGYAITLDRIILDRLTAMRGPKESYSDVIIRLARSIAEEPPREDDGYADG